MAIGRNFTEALQKALRSLERPGRAVLAGRAEPVDPGGRCWTRTSRAARRPAARACRRRSGPAPRVDEVHEATGIDPWFLDQLALIDEVAAEVRDAAELDRRRCCAGPSGTASPTPRSAGCAGMPEDVVRGVRHALGRPAGLQDRRHLRRRVRRADAVPLLVLRRGDRGRAARASRR